MHGKRHVSESLCLRTLDPHQTSYDMTSLPAFFGVSNRECRILGQMQYRLEVDYSSYVSISIFLKQVKSNTHEIHAVYDRRQDQN